MDGGDRGGWNEVLWVSYGRVGCFYLLLGEGLHLTGELELVLLHQGAAHVVSAGLEEGENHAAAVGREMGGWVDRKVERKEAA